MLPSLCTMLVPRPTYYHFLETKAEEHPQLICFHWIWKSNAMVFVLWWWLQKFSRMLIVSQGN